MMEAERSGRISPLGCEESGQEIDGRSPVLHPVDNFHLL